MELYSCRTQYVVRLYLAFALSSCDCAVCAVVELPVSLPVLSAVPSERPNTPIPMVLSALEDIQDADSEVSKVSVLDEGCHVWHPGVPSFEGMEDCIFLPNETSCIILRGGVAM